MEGLPGLHFASLGRYFENFIFGTPKSHLRRRSRVGLANVSCNSRILEENAKKSVKSLRKWCNHDDNRIDSSEENTKKMVKSRLFPDIELPISQKPKAFLKAVSLSLELYISLPLLTENTNS